MLPCVGIMSKFLLCLFLPVCFQSEWFFTDNIDDAPDLSNVALPPETEHEAVPSIEFLLENVGRKPGDAGKDCTSHVSHGNHLVLFTVIMFKITNMAALF